MYRSQTDLSEIDLRSVHGKPVIMQAMENIEKQFPIKDSVK